MNASANTMASLAMTGSTITVSQSRYKGGSCFFSTRIATLSSFGFVSKISTKTSDSRHHTSFFPARSWICSFGDVKTFKADHSKETFKIVVRVNSSAKEDSSQSRQAKGYRSKIPREKNPIRLSSSASPRVVLNTYEIIWYPLITESTMREMTKKNTLVFVVDKGANKDNIKEAARRMFGIETKKVNTLITFDGQKKAFLMLKANHDALKIAKEIKAL